jgi:hypothetical protein
MLATETQIVEGNYAKDTYVLFTAACILDILHKVIVMLIPAQSKHLLLRDPALLSNTSTRSRWVLGTALYPLFLTNPSHE